MSWLDRIIPPAALRWGKLTSESFEWWSGMVVYHGTHGPEREELEGWHTNRVAVRMEPGLLAPFTDWRGRGEPGPFYDFNRWTFYRAMFDAIEDYGAEDSFRK